MGRFLGKSRNWANVIGKPLHKIHREVDMTRERSDQSTGNGAGLIEVGQRNCGSKDERRAKKKKTMQLNTNPIGVVTIASAAIQVYIVHPY